MDSLVEGFVAIYCSLYAERMDFHKFVCDCSVYGDNLVLCVSCGKSLKWCSVIKLPHTSTVIRSTPTV